MRLIRAVRELNDEHGHGIRVIAMHTEAERRATFVRAADEAVLLRRTGDVNPYLDHAELGRALRECRADAAWVGWGFVAEDPAFAELCASLGVVFVGPPPEAMRRLGDKVEAKLLAESTGVPVAPWSGGPVGRRRGRPQARGAHRLPAHRQGAQRRRRSRHPHRARRERARRGARAHAVRGPALVRRPGRVHGAAGRGRPAHRGAGHRRLARQRLVARGARLLGAAAQPEARRGVELARAAAGAGHQPRGVRPGAGQGGRLRRRRAPSSSCTSPQEELFTFLEVNTRLQVEHPVTEAVTGLDLVKLQLHVADGGELVGEPPVERGHAVEARLNAEDADAGLRAGAGHRRAAAAADRPRRAGRHRHVGRRRHPARLRLDGRQDHRLGPRPAGGAGPAALRPARHHRGAARRDDDQDLPARPARPA